MHIDKIDDMWSGAALVEDLAKLEITVAEDAINMSVFSGGFDDATDVAKLVGIRVQSMICFEYYDGATIELVYVVWVEYTDDLIASLLKASARDRVIVDVVNAEDARASDTLIVVTSGDGAFRQTDELNIGRTIVAKLAEYFFGNTVQISVSHSNGENIAAQNVGSVFKRRTETALE